MPEARLEVTDALGRRVVPIAKAPFEIGRRETNDLRLAGSEVSRDHAEIAAAADGASSSGTAAPATAPTSTASQVTERPLAHGDRIRLGRSGGAEMVFLLADSRAAGDKAPPRPPSATCARLRRCSKACARSAPGRVLDDVLSLVLDSAIEVERRRARIHHAGGPDRRARVQDGAGPGAHDAAGQQLRDQPQDSRGSVPHGRAAHGAPTCSTASWPTCTWGRWRSASATCCACRCAWCGISTRPKRSTWSEERRIGVLYLDSREKGVLMSSSTRAALETLATEAAVAIENARLYRETMEKARMEQEMRIAAEIQQALLPKMARAGSFFTAAAASLPCRSIGGDFYDYVDLPNGALGFALGDVAGKGPPAALLSAMMQGIFAAQAASSDSPSQTISRVNLALYRRGIESRFVTLMYGALSPDGRLHLLQRRAQSRRWSVALRIGADVRRLETRRARLSACSRARPTKKRPSRSIRATG